MRTEHSWPKAYQCKGPEAEACTACPRGGKVAGVSVVERMRGKGVGGTVRDVMGIKNGTNQLRLWVIHCE